MWLRKDNNKAYGYWLAAPSSNDAYTVRYVHFGGYVYGSGVDNGSRGFRPVVVIPKASI